MKNKNLLLVASIAFLIFISYQATRALFSDTATSTNNTFIASDIFPGVTTTITPTLTPTATPTPKVVINEVFESGTNSEEWVELYNPNTFSIDVSGWKVYDGSSNFDTLPSTAPIPALSYAVIVANNSISVPSSAIKIVLGESIGSGLNGPGDVVRLKNISNVTIDEMSYGNNHSVFPTPPTAPSDNQSLARIPNGVDTDTADDWKQDSTPTIGIENIL